MLEESLFGTVIGGTCQSGQIEQHWYFLIRARKGLGREVEVEIHFTVRSGRLVAQLEEPASERGNRCFRRDRHGSSEMRYDSVPGK